MWTNRLMVALLSDSSRGVHSPGTSCTPVCAHHLGGVRSPCTSLHTCVHEVMRSPLCTLLWCAHALGGCTTQALHKCAEKCKASEGDSSYQRI